MNDYERKQSEAVTLSTLRMEGGFSKVDDGALLPHVPNGGLAGLSCARQNLKEGEKEQGMRRKKQRAKSTKKNEGREESDRQGKNKHE